MLKLNKQWFYLLGAACLLTACSEEVKPGAKQTKAGAKSTPAVITAMAQAKPMRQSDQSLKLANQIAAKKTQKAKLASKGQAIEAVLPTRTDQYTILFDLNSNQLNQAYKGELIAFAEYLNKNPHKEVHVDGFTCELGSAEYNVALGQRRAYAVARFLESKGVNARQIILVSYGKERPTDPSHNELAWMKNRRVEVFF